MLKDLTLSHQGTTVPGSAFTLSLFGRIAGVMLRQGLEKGCLYGALYGMCWGASGFVVGLAYGFGLGLMYGLIMGIVLGGLAGVVLGLFAVIWSRLLGRPMTGQYGVPDPGYYRGFVRIAVAVTIVSSVLLFPVVTRIIPPSLWDGSFLAYQMLDLMPAMIAGLAAYQSAQKVITWY